jgi:hypothetical protein
MPQEDRTPAPLEQAAEAALDALYRWARSGDLEDRLKALGACRAAVGAAVGRKVQRGLQAEDRSGVREPGQSRQGVPATPGRVVQLPGMCVAPATRPRCHRRAGSERRPAASRSPRTGVGAATQGEGALGTRAGESSEGHRDPGKTLRALGGSRCMLTQRGRP